MIEECLEKEICFTQETTLSGNKTLDTVKRAIAKDYYIRLYYVGLDTVDESLLRIANRVKKAVIILKPKLLADGLENVLRTCLQCCLTVTRQPFMTMTTASLP